MANPLLNVLHLISSLEVGGSEKLLVEFLAACRDDDRINFTVVVMNRAVNPDMQQRLERLGLNVYYLDRPEGHKHPKYLWQLMKIIHRHQVQVVHAHNFGSKLWGILCKLANPGMKLVFTVHDTMMMPRLDWKQILLHRHVIDQNVAISKTVASLCEQRGVKNHTQIYNGIPLAPFLSADKPSLQTRLAQADFGQKPLHIVHVGRMDYPVKGQDILIQAVQYAKEQGLNVRCSLMGGVYDYSRESFDELQAMVKDLDLMQEVAFLVNRTDVPEVLDGADLFVLPSRREGLGLVVLEAMAAGLPVIASDTDGPRELVRDGENGMLFESGNPRHLAERIRFIYENPQEADRMRENASHDVRRFDIHTMKRHYYHLYETLVPSASASGTTAWAPAQPALGRITE